MGKGSGGGRGAPRGGMPTGGKFGAGRIPGGQVQANLNNHANMQNPTSPVYHPPAGAGFVGGGGAVAPNAPIPQNDDDDWDD